MVAFFGQILRLSILIVTHPAVRYAFQQYTGKPLTAKTALDMFQTTRYYAVLQKHANQAAKGFEETLKFDPKNPSHYRPVTPDQYNPFAAKMKALKSGFFAAREAVEAEAKGKEWKPTYPSKTGFQSQKKPITKSSRLLDH